MSSLAVKLFEDRENKGEVTANPEALVRAVLGQDVDCSACDGEAIADAVTEVLFTLDENAPFGLLQRYFVEEYILHGKTKEAIAAEITANIDLLLADLESTSLRFLRNPKNSAPIRELL